MSQIPPPPTLPPVPGTSYPAPSYPPPRPTNGMAILALICGVLQCIPIITGVLAIIFGLLGIKKANNPAIGNGKGLALVGLVLGVLGLLGWLVFIGAGGAAYVWAKGQIEQPRETTIACLQALSAGDVEKAMTFCHSTMDKQQMVEVAKYLKPMGAFEELSVNGFNIQDAVTLFGTAKFQKETQAFRSRVTRENGAWKLLSIELRPASQPYANPD